MAKIDMQYIREMASAPESGYWKAKLTDDNGLQATLYFQETGDDDVLRAVDEPEFFNEGVIADFLHETGIKVELNAMYMVI